MHARSSQRLADQRLIHNSEVLSGKCEYVAPKVGGTHCILYKTILSAGSECGYLPHTSWQTISPAAVILPTHCLCLRCPSLLPPLCRHGRWGRGLAGLNWDEPSFWGCLTLGVSAGSVLSCWVPSESFCSCSGMGHNWHEQMHARSGSQLLGHWLPIRFSHGCGFCHCLSFVYPIHIIIGKVFVIVLVSF